MEKLIKFNLKMLPFHLILCAVLALGLILTGSKEDWFVIGLNAVFSLSIIGSVPLLIYYLMRRKLFSFAAFLGVYALFLLPYFLTVLLTGAFYFN